MELKIEQFVCPYCNKNFVTHRNKFNAHVYYCKENPMHDKIINKQRENAQKVAVERNLQKNGELKEFTVNCAICNKQFTVTEPEKRFPLKEKYYCSSSCAHTRMHSQETKNKIRETLLKRTNAYLNDHVKNTSLKLRACKVCNKEYYWSYRTQSFTNCTKVFCSKECQQYYNMHCLSNEALQEFQENGKRSAQIQSEIRRSKNEKLFCELCEKHFEKVTHNEAIFNNWDADVLIYDYKIAVLWNGPWHYKKITEKHSVEQVQNRDKIKILEINNAGWTPYIIKDMGKYNPTFVQEQFNIFIKSLEKIKN